MFVRQNGTKSFAIDIFRKINANDYIQLPIVPCFNASFMNPMTGLLICSCFFAPVLVLFFVIIFPPSFHLWKSAMFVTKSAANHFPPRQRRQIRIALMGKTRKTKKRRGKLKSDANSTKVWRRNQCEGVSWGNGSDGEQRIQLVCNLWMHQMIVMLMNQY